MYNLCPNLILTLEPKPRIWLGTTMLKRKAAKSEPILDEYYCAICAPSAKICLHTWYRFSTDLDWGESEEEEEEVSQDSDWDEDLAEEKDNQARAPLRRPRQLPKVLMFQSRKCSVMWPRGWEQEWQPWTWSCPQSLTMNLNLRQNKSLNWRKEMRKQMLSTWRN